MRRRTSPGRQLPLFPESSSPDARGDVAPVASASSVIPERSQDAASATVGPATPSPDLIRIARALPAALRLGTSSWSFPGWAGLVYDAAASEAALARSGLAAYAQHPLLRTVGIDRTYYAPIPTGQFARYAAAVPAGFRFLCKAHEACTSATLMPRADNAGRPGGRRRRESNPRFFDPSYAAEWVVRPFAEGLGETAGPLVFQFPPLNLKPLGGVRGFVDQLHAFLSALPRGPCYAVELRNADVLSADYAAGLRDRGACHCYNVHPSMPPLREQCVVVPLEDQPALVVRWMLNRKWGYEEARAQYAPFDRLVDEDPESRWAIVEFCVRAMTLGRSAYVVVNNKAEGSAPRSVFRLAEQAATRLSQSG
jgi:uncharacterized protein YecE (DUF72 family)